MASKRRENDGRECASKKKKRKEDRTQCIVEKVIQSLGYKTLRPEQEAVITGFLGNRDVFVCLPTSKTYKVIKLYWHVSLYNNIIIVIQTYMSVLTYYFLTERF